jgi:hypothetical protein
MPTILRIIGAKISNMSSLAILIILVSLLFIVMVGSYILVVKKYYWWGRGTPPPTGEEKRRIRDEELRLRASQMKWSEENPRKERKSDFWDNTKQP